MIWRLAFVIVVVVLPGSISLPAQSRPGLEPLLDRMAAYLTEYESQLSSVVATERFEQRVSHSRSRSVEEADLRFGEPGSGALPGQSAPSRDQVDRVTLESEVAFIRLPGGAEWLGFRDVRRANDQDVGAGGLSISEVLTSAAGDISKARAIAQASARYNLGLPRTINVPTAPLDIIHPRHRAAHTFERLGQERVRGTATVIVGFLEVARPTLVKEPSGRDLVSRGRIWLSPDTGTIWRIEWTYQALGGRSGSAPKLRVDFAPHELGFMVPITMTEAFSAPDGRGEGRAIYSNFRRFGTSARIVPQ